MAVTLLLGFEHCGDTKKYKITAPTAEDCVFIAWADYDGLDIEEVELDSDPEDLQNLFANKTVNPNNGDLTITIYEQYNFKVISD